MWMPRTVVDWLNVSLESLNKLREENAVLRAENTVLRSDLISTKVNLDWLRVQYNQCQLERAELMSKVNGIRTPVPELGVARQRKSDLRQPSIEDFANYFEDVGDEVAAKVGLPRYDLPTSN